MQNTQILQSIKIYILGAEIFHVDGEADGRTDMTKQIVALLRLKMRNFVRFHIGVTKHLDLQGCYTVLLGESLGCLTLECNFTFSGPCIVIYLLNLLKPTGHVMHKTVYTFNNCTFCPHCIYVFCIYLSFFAEPHRHERPMK